MSRDKRRLTVPCTYLQLGPAGRILPSHQLDDGGGECQPDEYVQCAEQHVVGFLYKEVGDGERALDGHNRASTGAITYWAPDHQSQWLSS